MMGSYLSLNDAKILRKEARALRDKWRAKREKSENGLHDKYLVLRTDGKPIDWCFVLELHDPLACKALDYYAELAAEDGRVQLASDLYAKLAEIE